MAWVRLDDGFADHPKIATVGAFGAWLQIQALCYANRNLTDGFIPWSVARAFATHGVESTDGKERVWRLAQTCGMTGRDLHETDWPAIMVKERIWEVVPGGYRIHDYDQYQPSKAEVEALRGVRAEAGRRGGLAKAQKRRGSHTTKAEQRRGVSEESWQNASKTLAKVCPVPVPVPLKEELRAPKMVAEHRTPDGGSRNAAGFRFRGPTVAETRARLKRLEE